MKLRRKKQERFAADQFELNFGRTEGPLKLGETVELRGEHYRVHALRPKLLVLWRL